MYSIPVGYAAQKTYDRSVTEIPPKREVMASRFDPIFSSFGKC